VGLGGPRPPHLRRDVRRTHRLILDLLHQPEHVLPSATNFSSCDCLADLRAVHDRLTLLNPGKVAATDVGRGSGTTGNLATFRLRSLSQFQSPNAAGSSAASATLDENPPFLIDMNGHTSTLPGGPIDKGHLRSIMFLALVSEIKKWRAACPNSLTGFAPTNYTIRR